MQPGKLVEFRVFQDTELAPTPDIPSDQARIKDSLSWFSKVVLVAEMESVTIRNGSSALPVSGLDNLQAKPLA